MRAISGLVTACVLAVATTGCGGGTSAAPHKAAPTSPASSATTPTSDLVGVWERTQTCQELVSVLTRYGLQDAILPGIAGDSWIPGVSDASQIKDPRHPCRGAAPRKHSHFFTADGQFGSRDATGQQVDDGPYRITGAGTVAISDDGTLFHYTVDDDTLTLEPVLPDCAPACPEAQWAVSVAYPGYTWHRVG
jgi:hypothetical protein